MNCFTLNVDLTSLEELLSEANKDLVLLHKKLLHLKSEGHTLQSRDFKFFLKRRSLIEFKIFEIAEALELLNSTPESATQ